MIVKMIRGCTRVCGKSQGFLGLPVRDVVENDSVMGTVPVMKTLWEPTPDELAALNCGGGVLITIYGKTPPPMRVEVELDREMDL